jgi:hypothetical protein
MNARERSSAEARARSERCLDWLRTLMIPGAPRPATKEKLFAWTRENIGATCQNFTVFMTGGSSRVPAIEHLMREEFPDTGIRRGDDFLSVALGLTHEAVSRYGWPAAVPRSP